MATLREIITAIEEILQDSIYTDAILTGKINVAVSRIAGGIRMPNNSVSPPLPDLFTMSTVTTSLTLPYVSLPINYQRKVMNVYDSSGNVISSPRGGNYYSFALFMRQINAPNMAEVGSVYRVAVQGRKLYYQGVPAAAETIGLHYYKKPTTMVTATDEPDGIPEHLQLSLIKHYVIKDIYGEMIEAGVTEPSKGFQYHEGKFYQAMQDLCDFIGVDSEPQYYGTDEGASIW